MKQPSATSGKSAERIAKDSATQVASSMLRKLPQGSSITVIVMTPHPERGQMAHRDGYYIVRKAPTTGRRRMMATLASSPIRGGGSCSCPKK